MSNIPQKLHYTKTHEWILKEEGLYTVGITDHAQTMLGDLVYLELPEPYSHVEKNQEVAVIESVKAAADIYSPVSGEVIEINKDALDNPEFINNDPYGKGWLFKIKPFDEDDTVLLNAAEYSKVVASEAH